MPETLTKSGRCLRGPDIAFEGEKKWYCSSPIANSGSYPRGRSRLLYDSIPDRLSVVPLEAFDDQSGFDMTGEIYVDEQPGRYSFARNRSRMTGAEFVAAITQQMKDT